MDAFASGFMEPKSTNNKIKTAPKPKKIKKTFKKLKKTVSFKGEIENISFSFTEKGEES
jgi:hypothetical protein